MHGNRHHFGALDKLDIACFNAEANTVLCHFVSLPGTPSISITVPLQHIVNATFFITSQHW